MAPTFLPFLAFLLYTGLSAISVVIFAPMLLIRPMRLLSQKVLITVLISFPCLIIVAILFGIIFLLPALLFSWLTNNNYITETPGIILAITGLLLFAGLVALCSLYLWYFLSRVIYKLLDKKSPSEFLDESRVFKYLQSYLKFKGNFFSTNGIIKIVSILVAIPVGAVICVCIYNAFSNLTYDKPTQLELVGKYHISNVTVRNFKPSSFDEFKLEFKRDSTFKLTPIPNIDVCDKGKYEVDYQFDYNEISFMCSNMITSAHIDRHHGYYRIEFIIGDPDSGESIYFEKDK